MLMRSAPKSEDITRDTLGPRFKKIIELVEDCQRRTRWDRAEKKFRSELGSKFTNVEILRWKSSYTLGMGVCVSASRNVAVFDGTDEASLAFNDDTFDLVRLMVRNRDLRSCYAMFPTASIGSHAVQRLLQRGAIQGDFLTGDLRKVLLLTEHVSTQCSCSGMDDKAVNLSILIPFRGGALVTARVPMEMENSGFTIVGPKHRLCVRTFLSGSMLSDAQRDRMALIGPEMNGLKISQMRGIGFHLDDDTEETHEDRRLRWENIYAQNARPWRAGARMAA